MCWRTCCARCIWTCRKRSGRSSPKVARTVRFMSMTTTADTTIIDAALLQLIWLASPALPVGGFSYSEGLEAAVDLGLVCEEEAATRWLLDQMHLTLSRSDLAATAQAIGAWRAGDGERIAQLN